mgnify:CR=1 FL=1
MRKIATALIIAVTMLTLFSPSVIAGEKNFLKLSEPKDSFITSSDKVLVTGETVPNTSITVLVNGRKAGEAYSVGAAGIFLTQVPISSKESIITVKASFPSGDTETASRKVYQLNNESELPELGSLIKALRTFLILK